MAMLCRGTTPPSCGRAVHWGLSGSQQLKIQQLHPRNMVLLQKLHPYKRTSRPSQPVLVATGSRGGAAGDAWRRFSDQASRVFEQQFLPIILVAALTFGYFLPQTGVVAGQLNLTHYTTILIFVIQGLALKKGDALTALQSTGSVAYGLVAILLLTPCAAALAVRLPLNPSELAVGLAVFLAGPTALSSGVSLTQMVGGNTALAMLLTVSSNVMAVFTVPVMLPLLLSGCLAVGASIALEPAALLRHLLQCVLMPMLAGVAARALIPGLAQVVDGSKASIMRTNALCLAAVPWVQVSRASAHGVPISGDALVLTALVGTTIHVAYLAANTAVIRALGLGGVDPGSRQRTQRALILVSSQKTLPVAVTLLATLGPMLGERVGLAAIACVLAHLGQILVDSWLVSSWMKRDQQEAAQLRPAT